MILFRSIIGYLEYTWRKWLQSVWNHEFFVHHKLTLVHNWRKNHHFYMPSIGICHNFPHHFSSSQGILGVFIGLVLFCFLFWFGGFFFLLPSYCVFAPLLAQYISFDSCSSHVWPSRCKDGTLISGKNWLHSQFPLLATHCWWWWDGSPCQPGWWWQV